MYFCEICNYTTEFTSNFCNHKKTKRHLKLASEKVYNSANNEVNVSMMLADDANKLALNANTIAEKINKKNDLKFYNCDFCNGKFNHRSSLSRHKKTCQSEINNEINIKMKILEKENEFFKKLEQEKSEMLKEKNEFINNFMVNANVLLNKANDNTKITAQTLQTVSSSALKYANDKFKDTPALLPLDNFNINNLDFDNEEDKKQLVELLIYNAKQKSLDKLLGDHIIKYYKKENPEQQSFHTTDCSRLNYIVRELIENALIWSIDKNGIKICTSIVKPLIKKCITVLMEHQKTLLNEMMKYGNYNKQKEVELIIDIIMSIDSGTLDADINKYIAPFFNLNKLENLNP